MRTTVDTSGTCYSAAERLFGRTKGILQATRPGTGLVIAPNNTANFVGQCVGDQMGDVRTHKYDMYGTPDRITDQLATSASLGKQYDLAVSDFYFHHFDHEDLRVSIDSLRELTKNGMTIVIEYAFSGLDEPTIQRLTNSKRECQRIEDYPGGWAQWLIDHQRFQRSSIHTLMQRSGFEDVQTHDLGAGRIMTVGDNRYWQ